MNAAVVRRLLWWPIVVALASCGGGGAGGGTAIDADACGAPGTRCQGVVNGMAFILYVPAKFKANSSALVMALHPRFTFGAHMENLSTLNATADEAGFAVLYPETPGR